MRNLGLSPQIIGLAICADWGVPKSGQRRIERGEKGGRGSEGRRERLLPASWRYWVAALVEALFRL